MKEEKENIIKKGWTTSRVSNVKDMDNFNRLKNEAKVAPLSDKK
jgi:hypothetical protein